jgi:hypothetical protein
MFFPGDSGFVLMAFCMTGKPLEAKITGKAALGSGLID